MYLLKQFLDLSYNKITKVPWENLAGSPGQLTLDISFNLLEQLSPLIRNLRDIDATGNPLTNILPMYRSDKEKVFHYSCVYVSCSFIG